MDTAISHEDDAAPTLRYRSIFISDIHLGTPGCQAGHLLDFLRHTDSRYLYLVGDIIDGWQLKRRWFWHQSHNDVIQKVLRKARKGTQVTYIAGNHDEVARQFIGLAFGGIDIRAEAEHVTADGRKLLVIHGDLFDAVVQGAKWLAYLGDQAYMITLKLNRWFNHLRATLGLPYWSLAQFLKHRVKNAVSYIRSFRGRARRTKRASAASTASCAATSTRPRSATSAGSSIATTAIGSRASRRWWSWRAASCKIIDWKAIEALEAITRHEGHSTGSGNCAFFW